MKDLFEFLDDIIPDDGEDEPAPKKKITRKRYSGFGTAINHNFELFFFSFRRSDSVVTSSTADSVAEDVSPANSVASSKKRNSKGKSKAK